MFPLGPNCLINWDQYPWLFLHFFPNLKVEGNQIKGDIR